MYLCVNKLCDSKKQHCGYLQFRNLQDKYFSTLPFPTFFHQDTTNYGENSEQTQEKEGFLWKYVFALFNLFFLYGFFDIFQGVLFQISDTLRMYRLDL